MLYAPVGICFAIIIIGTIISWKNLFEMIKVFTPAVQDEVTFENRINSIPDMGILEFLSFYRRLGETTKSTIIRMMVTPLLYIGVLTTVTVLIANGGDYGSQVLTLSLLMVAQSLNTILWIWTDSYLVIKWKNLLCFCQYHQTTLTTDNVKTQNDTRSTFFGGVSSISSNPIRDSSMSIPDELIKKITGQSEMTSVENPLAKESFLN